MIARNIEDIKQPVTSFELWKRTNNDFISRWVVLRGKKILINECGFYNDKLIHFDTCRCDEDYDRMRDTQ
jgi:hypothetical protein